MSERAAHSPSEQSIFTGNWWERRLLKHISNTALRLPEEFDASNRLAGLRVRGTASSASATIRIEQHLPGEEDYASSVTDIGLLRSEANGNVLTDLSADRFITDDVADLHGIPSPHELFALGAEGNTLSMFSVMRSVSLAARTVEGELTLAYLSRPEAGMPQID